MTDGGSAALGPRRRAILAREKLLHGDAAGARDVLEPVASDTTLELMVEHTRLEVAANQLDAAARLVERWPTEPEPRAHLTRQIWSAVIAFQRGEERRAIDLIAATVDEAALESYAGPFLEAGWPVTAPLRAQYHEAPTPFVRRILEDNALRPPSGGRSRRSARGALDALTDQEHLVLSYLPSRLSNAAIAVELGVSVNTVKTHLKHIYQKLGVTRRGEAIRVAERRGLL